MKFIKDILTHNGVYSQGRVYLFWSIIAFYSTLIILTYAGISNATIDIARFRLILDALEYALTLFGGYVFGGKFIDIYKKIKQPKENEKS